MLAVLVGIEYKLAAIALILCSTPLVVQNGSMHAIGEQPHPTPLRLHCHRSRTTGARTIAAATLHIQPLSVIPGTTSVTPTNCEMTQCYKSVH